MKSLNLPKKRVITGNAMIWKRIVAFVIDLIIINVIILRPFRNIFASIVPSDSFSEVYNFFLENSATLDFLETVGIMITILILLYFVILEYKLKQTPGKMIMNLYVTAEKKLKFWQCVVRSLFFIPIFPFILLWIIDPIYIFFSKDNQRLTERLSKTRVVEEFPIA